MKRVVFRSGMLLLETLVGLALLAMLGVWLIQLQAAALRQWSNAKLLEHASVELENLLTSWSDAGVVVTVPSEGTLSGRLNWRRECTPVALGELGLATQVKVTLMSTQQPSREVLTTAWLVPMNSQGKR